MGEYKVKLGAVLNLDDKKEVDIIKNVEYLKSKHKLGNHLCDLLRLEHDNKEEFKRMGMEDMPYSRKAFFNSIQNEINKCTSAIKVVQQDILEMKTIQKYKTVSGLEEKTEYSNLMLLSIQRHLEKIDKAISNDIDRLGRKDVDLTYFDSIIDSSVDTLIEMFSNIHEAKAEEPKVVERVVYVQQEYKQPEKVTEEIKVTGPVIEQRVVENQKIIDSPKIEEVRTVDVKEDDFIILDNDEVESEENTENTVVEDTVEILEPIAIKEATVVVKEDPKIAINVPKKVTQEKTKSTVEKVDDIDEEDIEGMLAALKGFTG